MEIIKNKTRKPFGWGWTKLLGTGGGYPPFWISVGIALCALSWYWKGDEGESEPASSRKICGSWDWLSLLSLEMESKVVVSQPIFPPSSYVVGKFTVRKATVFPDSNEQYGINTYRTPCSFTPPFFFKLFLIVIIFYYVAQADLKLMTIFPQLPKCWAYL